MRRFLPLVAVYAFSAHAQEASRPLIGLEAAPLIQVDSLEQKLKFSVSMQNIEPSQGYMADISSSQVFSKTLSVQETSFSLGGYTKFFPKEEPLSHGFYMGAIGGYNFNGSHSFSLGPSARYGFSLGPLQAMTHFDFELQEDFLFSPDARAELGGYVRYDFECGIKGVEHPFGACRVGADAFSSYSILKNQDKQDLSLSFSYGLTYGTNIGIRLQYRDEALCSFDGDIGLGLFMEWFEPF